MGVPTNIGMYLRHAIRRKNGKTNGYWQLVRSVLHGRKVKQETVAQLGELDVGGRARAVLLAREMTGRADELVEDRCSMRHNPRRR